MKKPHYISEPYGLPFALTPTGKFVRERNRCELCGKKLLTSEKDFSKVAICKKCLGGQFK